MTGGAIMTGAGCWTTTVLFTTVLLTVVVEEEGAGAGLDGAGFGGGAWRAGIELPMRPPLLAAWASARGTNATTRAASMDSTAPPSAKGAGASRTCGSGAGAAPPRRAAARPVERWPAIVAGGSLGNAGVGLLRRQCAK